MDEQSITTDTGQGAGRLTPNLISVPTSTDPNRVAELSNGPLLPMIQWPDIYKDKLDYLEYVSPVLRDSPFWRRFIGAYGQQDTALAYKPALAASRMKDARQNSNDPQLASWGLSSDGFNPDGLLGFKDFLPQLQTYWAQYVKDRGTSVSFVGFIEWCFNVDLTYVPLAITKESDVITTTDEHFLSKTALAGSTEITVTPPITSVEYAYVVQLATGVEIPASIVMQTDEGTVLSLAFPLNSIILENRSLFIRQVRQNPDSKLDINTLRPANYGSQSPEGPYYPSPYYDIYFKPRMDGTSTLSYNQLLDVLLYLKPIYLVQRHLSQRFESRDALSLSGTQALYTVEQEVICYANRVQVNNQQSSDAFRFWANSTITV